MEVVTYEWGELPLVYCSIKLVYDPHTCRELCHFVKYLYQVVKIIGFIQRLGGAIGERRSEISLAICRNSDDRQVRELFLFSGPSDQFEPAEIRQPKIGHHNVGVLGVEQRKRFDAVTDRDYIESLQFEQLGEHFPEFGIVFDDQNFSSHYPYPPTKISRGKSLHGQWGSQSKAR
jgi:hypothetical protein